MMDILRGFLGIGVLTAICYLFSNNRRAIDWKLVGVGLTMQLIFALLILKVGFVHDIFDFLSRTFVKLIDVSHAGTDFLFGEMAKVKEPWLYVFAIQVLPSIIFFSALSSLLYYLGVLQKIVYFFAWLLSKTMNQISGSESVSTAANIFLGQTEAPLMIRPYLSALTRSEVLCIMVGGMANTAGSVLAAYVGFLGGADPASRNFFALHMLSQSIMSAPAAIVAAKILYPQTDNEQVNKDLSISKEKIGNNVLDAIANGTTDGLKLAVNVAAMLIVFIALMAVLNYSMEKIGYWTHLNDWIAAISDGRYQVFNLKTIFGYLFAPLAWLIGVNSVDILSMGQLLGEKTIINEFVAYMSLGSMKAANTIVEEKTLVMATYALCGFANFSSIGIQIGGIGTLAPNQRDNLSSLGIKALLGGTIACLYTATIAGMLYIL
ncbi:MAG: NupC/NupG family nucleoside CNT transporter [Sphingobacteriales bacterium]|nr:NupC/NupG family nucleoside CNT transporter [Sphingobacteriales bacterium]